MNDSTLKIGSVDVSPAVGVAPMAGMTDTAFRRLVKRRGGCGLVVTEMVSSEGLVRGIDRTLEYAEYTEEERPVSIQVFGGDPETMAEAARIVEGMGADIVDINMGCPVHKISRHNAGCSLMREPEHAASVVRAMTRAVRIPVTVKMRAGWNEAQVNAPQLARMVEDAGAAAVTVHGRTAAQQYTGVSDWELISRVAGGVSIPVFGSGDCVSPADVVARLAQTQARGVLVGRGVLRNPWVLSQTRALLARGSFEPETLRDRGQFLLDYIDLLLDESRSEDDGFRHRAPMLADQPPESFAPARGKAKWVVNKLRALNSWYTKGLDGGSRLRTQINAAESVPQLESIIEDFFFSRPEHAHDVSVEGSSADAPLASVIS
jgi:tRNA-dihydrouridine synthase B